MTEPTWRPLTLNDMPSLLKLAATIHPSLPESAAIFTERIALFPTGCLALATTESNDIRGYIISHPILHRQPPALDTLLGEIHPDANQYYIHDLAILTEFQGRGFAKSGVERVIAVAEGYESTCLVSVYGSGVFWGRFGFRGVDVDEGLRRKNWGLWGGCCVSRA